MKLQGLEGKKKYSGDRKDSSRTRANSTYQKVGLNNNE